MDGIRGCGKIDERKRKGGIEKKKKGREGRGKERMEI